LLDCTFVPLADEDHRGVHERQHSRELLIVSEVLRHFNSGIPGVSNRAYEDEMSWPSSGQANVLPTVTAEVSHRENVLGCTSVRY